MRSKVLIANSLSKLIVSIHNQNMISRIIYENRNPQFYRNAKEEVGILKIQRFQKESICFVAQSCPSPRRCKPIGIVGSIVSSPLPGTRVVARLQHAWIFTRLDWEPSACRSRMLAKYAEREGSGVSIYSRIAPILVSSSSGFLISGKLCARRRNWLCRPTRESWQQQASSITSGAAI